MATIVAKLGSSVVARDDGVLRADALATVCDQVAALHREGHRVVVVTSGAIARGMEVMDLAIRPRAMAELQAASAVGQGKLYRVYDELLRERGVTTAQVLLTFFDMSARSHYLNARQTLRTLLDWRVVPVVNENDTTTTDEISFGDNDFLAAQVAVLLDADRLVVLTNIDGVFTSDPRRDPDARLVKEIRELAQLDELSIGHEASPLGQGGMRSKVVAAEMATAAGIEDGAARALRDGGNSLLPVGITGVEGTFDAGDAVEVVNAGRAIGKGICAYSATELRRVQGLKSSEVRDRLGGAAEEAVHRDYFVLA